MRSELISRLTDLGSKTSVIDADRHYSAQELLTAILEYESRLRAQQVRPRDVVVLNGDFSFDAITMLLALTLNGNIVLPTVNFSDTVRDTVTAHCHPQYLIRAEDGIDIATLPPVDRAAADLTYAQLGGDGAAGLVLLSSGSTGAPKAILHNLDALVQEKLSKRPRLGHKAPSILLFLLFDHIGGINTLFNAVLGGSPAVIPGGRSPEEICELVEKHEIRVLPTTPTFLNLLLIGQFHRRYDLRSLRLITYGTEPMPAELLQRINEAVPRAKLLQTFGTSETGISTTVSESSRSTFFKIEDSDMQYRIVDGELQLKSRTQFLGYLNYANESLTEDSWFKTGDLVELNQDGFLRVTGRAKEVVNVGGEKVLPLEVEAILMSSPMIEDCVAYGRPNAITGQSVWVDVKPADGFSRGEIRKHVVEFMSSRVERFKIPSKVNVVDSIEVSERFKKKRNL
ncbi:ANL family adenylate-forming protein [Nocardia sp. 004]|uniref:ANL family adenylate-forming protein n=1 Tax=Nocardia sp. 004 TaxID=3385978 RepID=UPI0039A17133